MNKKIIIVLSLILLIIISILSLLYGSEKLPISTIKALFINNSENLSIDEIILLKIRVPRLILTIGVGSSLALSGMLVQAVFRNPLVEPYTLGLSGGASLAIALSIFLPQFIKLPHPIIAFIGSCIVMIFILFSIRKNSNPNKILLTGVMISFITGSALVFILSLVTTQELQSILFWTLGSLEQSHSKFLTTLPIILATISTVIIIIIAPMLDILNFGDDEAISLGVNVTLIRIIVLIIATLLTSISVSLVGVIGFIGLVTPHICRSVLGYSHRFLTPAVAITGAIFLIISDFIARTVASPTIIPVGAITGLLGGILFIYLLQRDGYE